MCFFCRLLSNQATLQVFLKKTNDINWSNPRLYLMASCHHPKNTNRVLFDGYEEKLPPFAVGLEALWPIPSGFLGALTTSLDWLIRNDDLANAVATPVISSSDSVLVNTCSTSSSSELESAATGDAVKGAGSEKTTFLPDVEPGLGAAVEVVASAPVF